MLAAPPPRYRSRMVGPASGQAPRRLAPVRSERYPAERRWAPASTGSSRPFSHDGHAMQEATAVGIDARARVGNAAIVPNQKVPDLPAMGPNELRLGHVHPETIQEAIALRLRHAENVPIAVASQIERTL